MSQVPVQKAAAYAAADAEITFQLKKLFESRLADTKLQNILHEIEMPLVPVLIDMEMTGISLDVPFLKQMSSNLQSRLVEIEEQVQKAVGYPLI